MIIEFRTRMMYDLEREAFRASGLSREKIGYYVHRLDRLYREFADQTPLSSETLVKARQLFDWLWKIKPDRYRSQGHHELHDVIDLQINREEQAVGNCLGLTILYNSLLRRMDIHADALHLENAFGIGPHVLTLLPSGDSEIDIENILSEGFDYKGHLSNPTRTRWGDQELVADIHHSLGNENLRNKNLSEALRHYDRAIRLNPGYEKAHLNKAILMEKLGSLG